VFSRDIPDNIIGAALLVTSSITCDMSYYFSNNSTEHDSLLPKDEGAPEIHGSRPQSINEVYDIETEVFEEDEKPKRQLLNDAFSMIFGLCVLLSLALIFSPGDPSRIQEPNPKTVEQRVNRILTDTPLIGIQPKKSYIAVLIPS
jgi:membrane dipeptidase